jgi:Zn-dependent peptidase ImmA (M78 family)
MTIKPQITPKAHAEAILRELEISSLPIPVDAIAGKLGAALSYEPFEGKDDISGMLFRDERRIVIGINSAHASTRQRFSIAHEIGHLRMHHGDFFVDKTVRLNRDARSSMAIDPKEIEANRFAAELLMPEKIITAATKKRLAKKRNITAEELIEGLADECQVSKQAMEFRLINLGII